MSFYSPLRYPGGKNKLANLIVLLCKLNNIDGYYIEPYAGGASVALRLVIEGHVPEVIINDSDRSVFAFWHSVVNETDNLCELILSTDIDIDNWIKQKEVQKHKESVDYLSLGFSTFFLNRTNFSGVIKGGPIGGVKQESKYKIDCRFNKAELIKKIQKIAEYKNKIHVSKCDALELIKQEETKKHNKRVMFYFDPPYYLKGQSLYMNHYKHDDHENVGRKIQNIKNCSWVVSYDDVPEIREIYKDSKTKQCSFVHTAHTAKQGSEVLFFSDDLIIPNDDEFSDLRGSVQYLSA